MQLTTSSSALLASLLLALTSQDVLAAPFQGPGAKTLTFPLEYKESRGLHAQIHLQQRMNRNQRRMAKITGRAPPSAEQLKAKMEARITNVIQNGGAIVPSNGTLASNSTNSTIASNSTSATLPASSVAAASSTTDLSSSTSLAPSSLPSSLPSSNASSSVSSSAIASVIAASPSAGVDTSSVPVAATSQISIAAGASDVPIAPQTQAAAALPSNAQVPIAAPSAAPLRQSATAAGGAYLVIPGASLKKSGFKAVTAPSRSALAKNALGGHKFKHHKHHGSKDDGGDSYSGDDDSGDDNDDDGGDDNGDDSGGDNGDDSGDDNDDDSDSDGDDSSTCTKPGPVETVTNSTTPTTPDSLAVDIEAQDLGYFVTVMIGTPPKPYRVTIDSGSSDFWVEGAGCKTKKGDDCATDHAFLSEATSSTFVNTHVPWNITYGSGAVSGDIVQDTVAIDGIILANHTFGTATIESSDFSAFAIPYDGLMGLGLSSGSDQGVPNPVDAMAAAGSIKGAVTSYLLSRAADGKHNGEITFGAMDPSKFDSSTLVSLPTVGTDGFWETDMDAVGLLGGGNLQNKKRTAIHDTGTTNIIAPTKDADELHKLIPGAKSDGQGGYTLPCTTNATVTMTFGGQVFTIDPRDLSEGGPVDNKNPNGECVSSISADVDGDDGASQWLLGATFLKNVYLSTKSTSDNAGEVSLAKLV